MTIEILRSVSNCLATGTKLARYSLLLQCLWEQTKEFAAQRLFLEVGENWAKQGGWTKQDRQCCSLVNFKRTSQGVGGCQYAERIIAGNVFVPCCLVLIKFLVVPCKLFWVHLMVNELQHQRWTFIRYIYLSMALQPFVGPWPLFQFLDLFTQSVRLLGWGIRPSQGPYLHTEQYKHRINAHTSMPQLGFEPMIPVFQRAKTVPQSMP
jgi:hypothetical protein